MVGDVPALPTPLLLSPLQVGSIELPNRVVSTAHGAFLDFYRPGDSGERYIAYQERRARGGTGLIVLQPYHVHPTSQALGHYLPDPDDLAPKLRELVRRVNRHGARVLVQVLHFGAAFRSDSAPDLEPLWSFGSFLSPTGSEAAHEMTGPEIEEVIDGYVAAAELVVECGADGVEIQASHGYLGQQSMSPWANRREDEWGERDRFVRTLLERVRASVGREPVVGVRISVDDWIRPQNGGLGPAALREVAQAIVGTGDVDVLNVSAGARASHYSRSIGSYGHPNAPLLQLTSEMRDAIDHAVPVIGVSRILTPAIAERALATGACDLVGMTRAQIADPDLVAKLRGDVAQPVRRCVGANQGCVDRQQGGLPITCFHNPDVGREHLLAKERPVTASRRVLVVGAGPAGLKAAEVAAARGHAATLLDRAPEVGGRLRWLSDLGAAAELLGSVEWVAAELRRLGVTVELGVEVDEERLDAEPADAIILATGARPAPERLGLGDGTVPVVAIETALADLPAGQDVLVVDHLATSEVSLAAERLASAARSVTIVTPLLSVGAHIGFTMLKDQLQRLYAAGCSLQPSTAFTGIAGGEVTTRHVHSGHVARRRFDLVVAGVPGLPDLALRAPAEETGVQVLVAGDAVAPRSAMHAFREGDAAARAVAVR